MSDRFCCENNGNWGYQSSLAGCLSRCTNENTPYMTYKTNSRNCRCDRSCNRLCSYGSGSGNAIYQKGASGPLPTKFPTPYPTTVPTKFPTPCPDAGRGSITMKPAAAVAAASATAAAAEGAIPASPPTLASPTGAVEIANGTITSIAFPDRSLQYRVYSPENPSWPKTLYGSGGMQMVVYVTNLKNISRPSDASDMTIIDGLTKDNFLVAVVDYDGCTFHDALQFQKDINLL